MTDNNLPPHQTEDPWYSYQVKLRELSHVRALEEERSASGIITIIISHLFILNGAGIGAIPTIAAFFGETSFYGLNKFELFWLPGISFISGEILALICAFIAYIDHLYIAGFVRASCDFELAGFNNALPSSQSNQNLVDIVFGQSERNASYYNRFQKLSFWTAVICGFFSLLSFIAGCYFLTGVFRSIRGF